MNVWLEARALIAIAMALSTWSTASASAVADAESREHKIIEQERAAIEARFRADEAACRQRFVVSPCVEDAKRVRRGALGPLREREIELDASRRRRQSAERSEAIARKAADDAQRAKASPPAATRAGRPLERRRDATPQSAESAASSAGRRLDRPSAPHAPSTPRPLEAAPADPAAQRANFEARQEEAEQHRKDVESRNAARQAKRQPAAPLPLPASAAGSAPVKSGNR